VVHGIVIGEPEAEDGTIPPYHVAETRLERRFALPIVKTAAADLTW
jgi:hypothetical protein